MLKITRDAIEKGSCVTPPFGCGKQGPFSFTDEISAKEYQISALCQECQDRIFNDTIDEENEEFLDSRKVMNESD